MAHYFEYLPVEGIPTEEDYWDAIAQCLGIDVSEIADGDLAEYL